MALNSNAVCWDLQSNKQYIIITVVVIGVDFNKICFVKQPSFFSSPEPKAHKVSL